MNLIVEIHGRYKSDPDVALVKVATRLHVEDLLASFPAPANTVETLVASPRPAVVLPASRPAKAVANPPEIPILPERIPLVVGIWIEPGSDPGHAAHLEPVSTLLERLQREFPSTPFRLLVPPRIAQANWLRQVTSKAGCPVSLTTEIALEANPVETLVRHSHVILCLAPGQDQNEDIAHLLRWKREGRIGDDDPVFGGPVEFWDLSRGSRAKRQHLPPTLAKASFTEFARHVRAFNQRTSRLAPVLEEAVAGHKAELAPEGAVVELTRGQAATLERYAMNTAMGARFRPLARAAQVAWSLCAPLAGALLIAAAETTSGVHQLLLCVGLPLLLLAALARFLHGRWLHLGTHHTALGEAMRLHFVRCVSGLPGLRAAEIPLNSRAPRWLTVALDFWMSGLAQPEATGKPSPERIQHLKTTWLRLEAERFATRTARAHVAKQRYRKLATGTWISTALLALALATEAILGGTGAVGWLVAAGTALGVFAASLFDHRSALANLEAERAQRDARAFADSCERLSGGSTPAELTKAAQVIQALTAETLTANAEQMNHELEHGFSPLPDFR